MRLSDPTSRANERVTPVSTTTDTDPTADTETSTVGPPQCHSVKAVAASLGVGVSTVYRLVYSRELPAIKLGTRVLIEDRDLRAYIDRAKGAA